MPSVRCSFTDCNKKLSLVDQTVGKCSCKGIFCTSHKFPPTHNCKIDHNKGVREKLIKNNPAVVAEKILQI